MRCIRIFSLYCFSAFCLSSFLSLNPDVVAGSESKYVGTAACQDCHDTTVSAFSATRHGHSSTIGMKTIEGCEACHGAASKHIESGGEGGINSFKTLPSENINSICLACHRNTRIAGYRYTEHNIGGVSCTNCHVIHKARGDKNLKTSPETLCASCHRDIAAKFRLPSHHPVAENKMTCLDCHDPHGGSDANPGGTPDGMCFKCHADKEGPFTFEHAPVVENCLTCHDPHGTIVNKLLKKTELFLCLQCHHIHFQIREHHDARGMASSACTHCHTAIHGSDFPSALKSSSGRALTR